MKRALVVALVSCGRLGFEAACSGCDGHPQGPNNIAFVTSTTHVLTTFGSDLSGADAICNMRAKEGGLPGSYVAYASTTTVGARDRLAGARGWVRVDGTPFVDQIADLIAGRVLSPLEIDELGQRVPPLLVATASSATGTLAPSDACTDFTNPAQVAAAGLTTATASLWSTSVGALPCSMSSPIYCFGVGLDNALAFTPASGRLAFVTDDLWTPGGGLASADAFCMTEAANARLSGSFRALLSTSTATAGSRFSTTGSTWVRPDGVALASSALAFMSVNLGTSLNVTQSKAYVSDEVWVGGGGGPLSTASRTCVDWTSTTDLAGGSVGNDAHVDSTMFSNGGELACSAGARLYCLEP